MAHCVRGVGHGGRRLATERTAMGMMADVLQVALQVGLQPGKATATAMARLRKEVHPLAEGGDDVGTFFERCLQELCSLSATYPMTSH